VEDELIYQQKPTCLEYENTQPKYLYEEMKTCKDQRVQAVHNVEPLLKVQQKKTSSALEHSMNRNIILQRCIFFLRSFKNMFYVQEDKMERFIS
jgi:hypothetical protein